MEHLKFKFREDAEEMLDKVPTEMQEFFTLSIFDREKFDRIEIQSYEVTKVGKVEVSNNEESVLKMHPTFSIIEDLKDGALEFEQELVYAKVIMEMKKELEEKLDEEDAIELTPEEEEKNAEEDARARFTFDPLNKVFDDRKRRVTYLQECSRVTLAKPLPTEHETQGMHTRIYNQYRK